MPTISETNGPISFVIKQNNAPIDERGTSTASWVLVPQASCKGNFSFVLKKEGSELASIKLPLKSVASETAFMQLGYDTAEADNGSTGTYIDFDLSEADLDAGKYTVEMVISGNMDIVAGDGAQQANYIRGNGHCEWSATLTKL